MTLINTRTCKTKIFAIRTDSHMMLGPRTLMPWGHSLKIQEPSSEEFEYAYTFFCSSCTALSADMYARGSHLSCVINAQEQ